MCRPHDLITRYVEACQPYTPLHIAASYSRPEALEILIEHIIHHNRNGDECYCLACRNPKMFCFNCTTAPRSPIHCDSQGYMPIHFAVASTPSPRVSATDIDRIIRMLLHFGGSLPDYLRVARTASPMYVLIFHGFRSHTDTEKALPMFLAGSNPNHFWRSLLHYLLII